MASALSALEPVDARHDVSEDPDPNWLTMAPYRPSAYRWDGHVERFQEGNSVLLRLALVKRFESSHAAAIALLSRLIASHQAFLDGLDGGVVVRGLAFGNWASSDSERLTRVLAEHDGRDDVESAGEYVLKLLQRDVLADLVLLKRIRAQAELVEAREDRKAQCLIDRLAEIAAEGTAREEPDGAPKVVVYAA